MITEKWIVPKSPQPIDGEVVHEGYIYKLGEASFFMEAQWEKRWAKLIVGKPIVGGPSKAWIVYFKMNDHSLLTKTDSEVIEAAAKFQKTKNLEGIDAAWKGMLTARGGIALHDMAKLVERVQNGPPKIPGGGFDLHPKAGTKRTWRIWTGSESMADPFGWAQEILAHAPGIAAEYENFTKYEGVKYKPANKSDAITVKVGDGTNIRVALLAPKSLDSGYLVTRKLGAGSFGKFRYALKYKDDGKNKLLAVKECRTVESNHVDGGPSRTSTSTREQIHNEFDRMEVLGCKVKILDRIEIPVLGYGNNHGLKIYGIMDLLYEFSLLFSRIKKLPDDKKRAAGRLLLWDIATDLQKCHQKDYAHRDLKPENIFVRDDGYICLMDYGGCLKNGVDSQNVGYTPGYRPDAWGEAQLSRWTYDIYALMVTWLLMFGSNIVATDKALKAIIKETKNNNIDATALKKKATSSEENYTILKRAFEIDEQMSTFLLPRLLNESPLFSFPIKPLNPPGNCSAADILNALTSLNYGNQNGGAMNLDKELGNARQNIKEMIPKLPDYNERATYLTKMIEVRSKFAGLLKDAKNENLQANKFAPMKKKFSLFGSKSG